jgi:hypothetical protein
MLFVVVRIILRASFFSLALDHSPAHPSDFGRRRTMINAIKGTNRAKIPHSTGLRFFAWEVRTVRNTSVAQTMNAMI